MSENSTAANASKLVVSRRGDVEPFLAMEVVGRAAELTNQGKDIVMMCVGQPDAPAPTPARLAAQEAAKIGRIGYTPSPGHRSLREAIAKHYERRYDQSVDPGRIVVTTGSSAGFVLAFLACFDEGARIAIPSPGYPAYRNILRALSLKPVEIETQSLDRWVLTPEQLAKYHQSERLDGILVANPNNPNGTMMEPGAFRRVVEFAKANAVRLISDEIYHGLTYGREEITAVSPDQNAIIINSFSKYFCMTGWRIGWMVVPDALLSRVNRLQQNLFISAPEISQFAAIAAFDGLDELEQTKAGYAHNRDMFLKRLPALGFKEIQPIDGAFYAYCDASDITSNTLELSSQLLDEAGVATTPGLDFDPSRGHHWLRLSFCGEFNRLSEGLDRIEQWLGDRKLLA